MKTRICLFLVSCIAALGLTGCAGTQQAVPVEPEIKPHQLSAVFFKYPLKVTVPAADPLSTEEFVYAGLFFFQEGSYVDAAQNFEEASDRILETGHPLRRLCLMSAAVCYLLLDDKALFVDTVEKLRLTYTRYQLTALRRMEPRARALLDMCEKIKTEQGL